MSRMTTSQRRSHTAINCDHTRELNANPFASIPKTICIWFYYFLSLICLLSAEGFIVSTVFICFSCCTSNKTEKSIREKTTLRILHSDTSSNTNMIEIKIHPKFTEINHRLVPKCKLKWGHFCPRNRPVTSHTFDVERLLISSFLARANKTMYVTCSMLVIRDMVDASPF